MRILARDVLGRKYRTKKRVEMHACIRLLHGSHMHELKHVGVLDLLEGVHHSLHVHRMSWVSSRGQPYGKKPWVKRPWLLGRKLIRASPSVFGLGRLDLFHGALQLEAVRQDLLLALVEKDIRRQRLRIFRMPAWLLAASYVDALLLQGQL